MNDLIARCSAAYVMKEARTRPPNTINPNLLKQIKKFHLHINMMNKKNLERSIMEYLANSAVIPRRQGNEGAAIAKNAIPNP